MTKKSETNTPPAVVPASSSSTDHDIDAIAPAADLVVTFGAQEFTVRPMRVRQLLPFLQRIRPILAALAKRPASSPAAAGLPSPGVGDGQGGTLHDSQDQAINDGEWMLGLLEKHGAQVLEALAIGLDSKPERLDDLTVVDVVVLCRTFVQVNADFFAARGLTLPQNPLASASAAVGGVARAAATIQTEPPKP